jgi:hypothetical protein
MPSDNCDCSIEVEVVDIDDFGLLGAVDVVGAARRGTECLGIICSPITRIIVNATMSATDRITNRLRVCCLRCRGRANVLSRH